MMIDCRCGCGGRFQPSRATLFRLKRGDAVGYLPGHGGRGARNPRWRGGTIGATGGYRMVLMPTHPNALKMGYVHEHRLVMSQMLGRPLTRGETVHHKNGDKTDNRPENLELLSRAIHAAFHMTGDRNPRHKPIPPKTCPTCGAVFQKPWRLGNHKRARFCSRACIRRPRR